MTILMAQSFLIKQNFLQVEDILIDIEMNDKKGQVWFGYLIYGLFDAKSCLYIYIYIYIYIYTDS